jgi:hypothetical protein
MSIDKNDTPKLTEPQRKVMGYLNDGDKIYRSWNRTTGSWVVQGQWGTDTIPRATIDKLVKVQLVYIHREKDWNVVRLTAKGRAALSALAAPQPATPDATVDADEREQVKALLITLPAQRIEGLSAMSALYDVRRAAGSIAKDKRHPVTERLANLKIDEMGPKEATNLLIELIGKYMSGSATRPASDAPATATAAAPQRAADEAARTPKFALLPQCDLMNLNLDDLREARLELPACEREGLLTGEPVAARHEFVQSLIELRKVQERLKQAQKDVDRAYAAMIEELNRDSIARANHAPPAPGNGTEA